MISADELHLILLVSAVAKVVDLAVVDMVSGAVVGLESRNIATALWWLRLLLRKAVHDLCFYLLDKLLCSQDRIFVDDLISTTFLTVVRLWALTHFDTTSIIYGMLLLLSHCSCRPSLNLMLIKAFELLLLALVLQSVIRVVLFGVGLLSLINDKGTIVNE